MIIKETEEWFEGFEVELREMKCPANEHCAGISKVLKEIFGE